MTRRVTGGKALRCLQCRLSSGTWPCSNLSNPRPAPCRTETMVEKLLTNWLSICLYTFLRVRGAPDCTFSPCSLEGLSPH